MQKKSKIKRWAIVQPMLSLKWFRSEVAIAEVANARFDEELFIDLGIDGRRDDPHLGEGVRYRMHTCFIQVKTSVFLQFSVTYIHSTITM